MQKCLIVAVASVGVKHPQSKPALLIQSSKLSLRAVPPLLPPRTGSPVHSTGPATYLLLLSPAPVLAPGWPSSARFLDRPLDPLQPLPRTPLTASRAARPGPWLQLLRSSKLLIEALTHFTRFVHILRQSPLGINPFEVLGSSLRRSEVQQHLESATPG